MLACDCSAMCDKPNMRRLAEVPTVSEFDIDIVFTLRTEKSVIELLTVLQDGSTRFVSAASLSDSTAVALTAYQYTAPGVSGEEGGFIHTLLDLTIGSSLRNIRRLSEIDLSFAVRQAFLELVPLPAGTEVACEMSSGSTANLSLAVSRDLVATEKAVMAFLVADSAGEGPKQLPALISAYAGGIEVRYAPGYVPIVWTSNGPSLVNSTVNLIPYILAGVGLILLVLGFLMFKYRMVIKSALRDVWEGRWRSRNNGGWTMGRFAALFAEREKSDISSTPDTATNVDDNEFDDLFLREMDRPMSRPSISHNS